MKKSFLLALPLPMILWAAPAASAPSKYTGFYYDVESPAVLADLVEKSLHRDRTGKIKLDPAKCKKDGSCATPLNYLESFRAHNPTRELTLEGLPAFIRSLVKDCTFTGVLQMDRIERATGRTDINGMNRTLDSKKRECVFKDPETGMPVLAQWCANPIGVRIDLDCVYIDFEVKDEREKDVIWARYERPTDPCFAHRETTSLYQPDSPKALWHRVHESCTKPCTLEADDRFIRRRHVAKGLISLPRTGTYQIRLSPDELVLLCLKLHVSRTQVESSFGNFVRWKQDYRFVNRAWHARVYYESSELFKDGKKLNGPGGLTFYASDAQTEATMNGLISQ